MTTEERNCGASSLLSVTCNGSSDIFNHNPKTRHFPEQREKLNRLMNKQSILPSKTSREDEISRNQQLKNVAEPENSLKRIVAEDPSNPTKIKEGIPNINNGREENNFSTSKELDEEEIHNNNEINEKNIQDVPMLCLITNKETLNGDLKTFDNSFPKNETTDINCNGDELQLQNYTRSINQADSLITMHNSNERLENKTINGCYGTTEEDGKISQNYSLQEIEQQSSTSSTIRCKPDTITDYINKIIDNKEYTKSNGNSHPSNLLLWEHQDLISNNSCPKIPSAEKYLNTQKIEDTKNTNQDSETSCINKEIFKTKHTSNGEHSTEDKAIIDVSYKDDNAYGESLGATYDYPTEDNKNIVIDALFKDNTNDNCITENKLKDSINPTETRELIDLIGDSHSNNECAENNKNLRHHNLRLNSDECSKDTLSGPENLRLTWALIEDTSPSSEYVEQLNPHIINENMKNATSSHSNDLEDINPSSTSVIKTNLTDGIDFRQAEKINPLSVTTEINTKDVTTSSHLTETSDSINTNYNDEFISSINRGYDKTTSEEIKPGVNDSIDVTDFCIVNNGNLLHNNSGCSQLGDSCTEYTKKEAIFKTDIDLIKVGSLDKKAAQNIVQMDPTDFNSSGSLASHNENILDSPKKRNKPRLNLNLKNFTSSNNQNVFDNINPNFSNDENDSSNKNSGNTNKSAKSNQIASISDSIGTDHNQRLEIQTYDINKNNINLVKHAEEFDLHEQVEELADLSIRPEEIKIITENIEQHALSTLSPDCLGDISFESCLNIEPCRNKEDVEDLALFAKYIQTAEEVPETICEIIPNSSNTKGEEYIQYNTALCSEIPNNESLCLNTSKCVEIPQVSINSESTESLSSESREFCTDKDSLLVEEDDRRVRRCSSLKTGKTPPGTPGRKKIVRFADVLGLDLADVRTFLDEIPKIPSSAYNDLAAESEFPTYSNQNLKNQRVLLGLFRQPGGQSNFLEKVTISQVMLENAVVEDPISFSIRGLVRVRNIDYDKQVHVRYSLDSWKTFSDLQAVYLENSCDGFTDKFTFLLYAYSLSIGQKIEFAIRFQSRGVQFWDNNGGSNYCFQCLPASNPMTYSPITSGVDDQIATFYYMEATTAQIHDLKENELTNTAVQEYIMKSLQKNKLQSNHISKGELYMILVVLFISMVFLYIKMH